MSSWESGLSTVWKTPYELFSMGSKCTVVVLSLSDVSLDWAELGFWPASDSIMDVKSFRAVILVGSFSATFSPKITV